TEERLQQVRLFGLGGKAGGWSAALDVAYNKRDLHGNGQAQRLRFQSHSGARRRGDGQRPRVCRADRRRDGSNFVFRLKGHNAKVFVLREFMQNVRSRGNRVTALKQPQAGFLRRGNKSQRERLVTAHAPVESRRKLRWRNLIADLKCFRGL